MSFLDILEVKYKHRSFANLQKCQHISISILITTFGVHRGIVHPVPINRAYNIFGGYPRHLIKKVLQCEQKKRDTKPLIKEEGEAS